MSQQNAQLFAGDLFVSFEKPDGSFSAATMIRADLISITTPSDKKQKFSKGRKDYGQAFATYPLPKPTEFEITFSEMSRALLAIQLSGTVENITAAGGAFADLPVTAALDGWADIGRKNIDPATLVVKNSAGSTTYVAGTDYELNPRLGKLRAIPGGAITDAQALKATGTAKASTGTRIVGASKFKHVMRLEMDGLNLLTQQDGELTCPRAVVTSDQAFDFLQSDIAQLKLKGTLEVPAAGVPPFTFEERIVTP